MIRLILTIAIAGFFMQAQAQNLRAIDIPLAVTDEFNQAYPSIQIVDWSRDSINFAAAYKADSLKRSVKYNSSGKLVEIKSEILAAALPGSATEYLRENYKDDDVNATSEITDSNGIVTNKTKMKGMDLTSDSEGNFVKPEINQI